MPRKKFSWMASNATAASLMTVLLLAPGAAAANKYKTLHTFSESRGGNSPLAGMIFDAAGNLYGTTRHGGTDEDGTVFELSPRGKGGWKEKTICSFKRRGHDGGQPFDSVVFDSAGSLYGTTAAGGNLSLCNRVGCGVVFKLTKNVNGSWTESVLYRFMGGNDGWYPTASPILDRSGSLYGTTMKGGTSNAGTVFKLIPKADGTWTESVLHSFNGGNDGANPYVASLIVDLAGNLYGTTGSGGAYGGGVVYRLTPNTNGTWTETVLYSFTGGDDGAGPEASVIFDQAGNLYGTTAKGGSNNCSLGCGTVFRLTPNVDGRWTETLLYSFAGNSDGSGPYDRLIFDQAGNLYGTTFFGGYPAGCNVGPDCGVVFKLAPTQTGPWRETVLHAFRNHPGANPFAGVVFDAAGNLYGTTKGDGVESHGSIFEITAQEVAHTLAYVANNFSNSVSVIDTRTKSVIDTIAVGSVPTELAISVNHKHVLVTNQFSGSVSVISTATNSVVATVSVGSTPVGVAVAPNGKLAYVTIAGEDALAIIDMSTFAVIGKVPVGPAPVRVSITPDGCLAYVSNQNSNFVSIVDTATKKVVNTIVLGSGPYGLKFTPDGTRAYAAVVGANSVAVIDTRTLAVVAVINVGANPTDVAITGDGAWVYVNNEDSNTVSVIATSTNTVIATVPVGKYPACVAVSPNQKFVYVSDDDSNRVSIIDTVTNTVTGSVTVGSNPVGVIIAIESLASNPD